MHKVNVIFLPQISASEMLLPTMIVNNTKKLEVVILMCYQVSFRSLDSLISCTS
jgi:hypothetical protein